MMDVSRRSAWGFWGLPVVVATVAVMLAGLFAADEPRPADRKASAKADAEPMDEKPVPENPFPDRPMAPDLEGGTGWLNTSGEISLKDLRGKVVILDFWTYCCINCMHVLPDLKFLEEKYAKELVVIGVHSAKFDNEKDSENIRKAIMRYEIEHPVINDSQMKVWQKFGVNAWPTLVVIDPEGRYLGEASGEGNRELLDVVLQKIIAYHKAKGTLDTTPVKFALEGEKVAPTPLRFPGKILADKTRNRLFISDSNHNRIVVTTLSGKLIEVIGSGRAGSSDGSFSEAEFDHPQGMELVGQTLYVADTENHLLRAVDLQGRTVTTIAGTGEQVQDRQGGGVGTNQGLNSPWDLCWLSDKLYVAMAGPHQIWVYNPADKTIGVFAGSGREDVRDGDLASSAFAQPSGLTTDGTHLYGVCSEGSAIRQIPLDGKSEVKTLAGTHDLPRGRSLFEFGDVDGAGDQARLQHPIGICFHKGLLYVTDSYNHKLKTLDPKTGQITTFLGDGTSGNRNQPPRFFEPAGVTAVDNRLYVADTNNHLIRVVDLMTKKVSTLTIEGLAPPKKPELPENDGLRPLIVEAQKVAGGESLTFEVTVPLPEGYKLNKLAAPFFRLSSTGEQSLVPADQLNQRTEVDGGEGNVLTFRVPLAAKSGTANLTLTLTYNYCRDGVGGLCKLNSLAWTIPVIVAEDAMETAVKLSVPE